MSFFHSPNIVTNGLVMCVDAANPRSYPGTGTSWYDISGGSLTGTLTNGVGYNSNYKGILTFDGTNDYVSFPNSTSLDSQTITMESWSNINSLFQNGFLFEKGQVNTQYSNFYNSDGTFYFRTMGLSNQDLTFYIPSYIAVNTWNHIVCTYGGGVKTIYLNGVQIAQTTGITGTISTNATGLFIGAYGPGTGYFLNGKIAQSRIYNKALTASEILQNYNSTQQRFVYAYSEGNNAAPYVANWNNTTTFTMNQFGGLGKVNAHGWTTGPATYTLTLSSLPVHTEVRYKVFWHLVDSLDNETNQLFTMNSAGGETEKLRFTKAYNTEPAISVQDTGVIAPWSGHQVYTYRPWGGGAYGHDGYLSIDTGFYSHTANSFTARHVLGADQVQADEAEYLSHVQVYLR